MLRRAPPCSAVLGSPPQRLGQPQAAEAPVRRRRRAEAQLLRGANRGESRVSVTTPLGQRYGVTVSCLDSTRPGCATQAGWLPIPPKNWRDRSSRFAGEPLQKQGSGCIIHQNIALSRVLFPFFGVEKATCFKWLQNVSFKEP